MSLYIDNRAGRRSFITAVALSLIVGITFRLYFSPSRMKHLVQGLIDRQASAEQLSFAHARLSLARGARPDFAIVLSNVRLQPPEECYQTPSVSIHELTLPLRILNLLHGQASIGLVSAQDLEIDIDGLKARCSQKITGQATDNAEARTTARAYTGDDAQIDAQIDAHTADTASRTPLGLAAAHQHASDRREVEPPRWWSAEQLQSIESVIEGFEFHGVKVYFENKSKYVYLESFSARANARQQRVTVTADIRVPAELVFGETLPLLALDIDAKPDAAEVQMKAHLEEGKLLAHAVLHPSREGGLKIESEMHLTEVPLSTVLPLLQHAGIAQGALQPKFLWLDCSLRIAGPFQGLFNSSPLYLDNCSIEGSGSHIVLEKAVRHPDGNWEPFLVRMQEVDLNRVAELFAQAGPRRYLSDFGRLSGELDIRHPNDAQFAGSIDGAVIDFENRQSHAYQKLKHIDLGLKLDGRRWVGVLDKLESERGDVDGEIDFDVRRDFSEGIFKARFDGLTANSDVQRLLTGGTVQSVSGDGALRIEDQSITAASVDLKLNAVKNSWFEASALDVSVRRVEKAPSHFQLRADRVEVPPQSPIVTDLKALFFEHDFFASKSAKEPFVARDFVVDAEMLDDGGKHWNRAAMSTEAHKIMLSSIGDLSATGDVSGSVMVDYPSVKKLKWLLSGTEDRIKLTPDARTSSWINQAQSRSDKIDDSVLGLALRKRSEHSPRAADREQ